MPLEHRPHLWLGPPRSAGNPRGAVRRAQPEGSRARGVVRRRARGAAAAARSHVQGYPKGEAPEVLETLATLYRAADAFVIVTGEYNHSVPPALTNLLDHFLEEYFFRPSAIVSYSGGQFGGVRAAVHLQAILCELGMPSIASTFPVPRVAVGVRRGGQRAHARRRPALRSLRRGAGVVRGGAEATAGGKGDTVADTCHARVRDAACLKCRCRLSRTRRSHRHPASDANGSR